MYAIPLSAYKHNHYINTLLKFPHVKHQTLEIKLYFSPKKTQQQQKQCHLHTRTQIYINYHNLWGISCGDHRHWDLGYELGTACKQKKKLSIYKYKYTIITLRHRIESNCERKSKVREKWKIGEEGEAHCFRSSRSKISDLSDTNDAISILLPPQTLALSTVVLASKKNKQFFFVFF